MKLNLKWTPHKAAAALFCTVLAVFFAAFLLTPKQSFSQNEKKELSKMPQLTFSSLWSGDYFKGVDSYVTDHFPGRDFMVGAGAYCNLLTGRNGANGIYKGSDGYLIPTPFSLDEARLMKNEALLRRFCETTTAKVTVMPVPSIGFVMEEKLPKAHAQYRDDAVYQSLGKNLPSNVEMIDLRKSFLEEGKKSQLFYKTDHHWTGRGAYLAYQSFSAARGRSAALETDFMVERISGFHGTSYSKSGLWLEPGDTMELWHPVIKTPVTVEVTDDDLHTTVTRASVFFREYLTQGDRYPVYLGGNHSLVKLTNPAAPKGKLLLIKDSFANSFAPFLTRDYQEVYLIDLRYYKSKLVSEFVKSNGIREVLFLYSTEDFANDTNFIWLK